jgi:two-component system, LytTR family, sensor kinase
VRQRHERAVGKVTTGAARVMSGPVLGVWLVVATIFIGENVVGAFAAHQPLRWLPAVWFEVEYWAIFAACTPLFALVVSRFPVERGRAVRNVTRLAAVGIVFALIQPLLADALNYATLVAVRGSADPRVALLIASRRGAWPVMVVIAFWKYAVVIAVLHAIAYYHRVREQERQAAVAQLQPHFLFNALHSAGLLTFRDPVRAQDFLARLADLIRDALPTARPPEIPLTEELEFIDRYLAIERMRFEDRLGVAMEVSRDAEDALVPTLLLQPLVENAIHHAFARHSTTRHLTIRATVESRALRLEVEDDGPGLPAGWIFTERARTGLSSVQSRVDFANGAPRPLTFRRVTPNGLCVTLTIPHRPCIAS